MKESRLGAPEVTASDAPINKKNDRITGSKDTHYKNDAQRIYDYFFNNTDTRLGAFLHTGVLEKSICRYVDDFISDGRAQVVRLGRSPQSGIKNVQFISCNPALFNKQVTKPRDLFDDYGTD